MKKILVTGGAGYIGSHLVRELVQQNASVIVLDNLSTGFSRNLPKSVELIEGDLRDEQFVLRSLEQVRPDSVVHLAAKIFVAESMEKPVEYFQNNVTGSLNLIKACQATHVQNFIFSSTAAVYSGIGATAPIPLTQPPMPQNPYGASKLMVEEILQWVTSAKKMRAIALRYFNVAGASLDHSIGQRTRGSSHLIKRIAEFVVGKVTELKVFGKDYDTIDGTCVRDYIHVLDLVDLHIRCLTSLDHEKSNDVSFRRFNCGYGVGHSVLQVISAAEELLGQKLNYSFAERRPGDPAILVADPSELSSHLKWKPKYSDLVMIVKSAIEFERQLTREGAQ